MTNHLIPHSRPTMQNDTIVRYAYCSLRIRKSRQISDCSFPNSSGSADGRLPFSYVKIIVLNQVHSIYQHYQINILDGKRTVTLASPL
jgi:hypothetical protein